MDIFKMLNELLENSEFAKNDGYDDFKEQVYDFSYKISGSERKYGITHMMTFFNDKKEGLPLSLTKEFFKLMNLLGHGPGGVNGDCLAFEGPHISVWETRRIESEEEDGKIVTKITDKLDSTSNVSGFAKQLSKLGQIASEKDDETKENVASPDALASSGESAPAASDSAVASSTTASPGAASPGAASVALTVATIVATELAKK